MQYREIDDIETVVVAAVEIFVAVERQQVPEHRKEFTNVFRGRKQLFVGLLEPAEKVEIGDHDRRDIEKNRPDEMDPPVPRHHILVHRGISDETLVIGVRDIESGNHGSDD